MFNVDIILVGLVITSALIGLVTEAVKKILIEHNIAYKANTLAGIISVILSAVIGVGYVIMTDTVFGAQVIVYLVAYVVASWMGAMVGYDKIIQTISQYKITNK
jgi:hypothetical protein